MTQTGIEHEKRKECAPIWERETQINLCISEIIAFICRFFLSLVFSSLYFYYYRRYVSFFYVLRLLFSIRWLGLLGYLLFILLSPYMRCCSRQRKMVGYIILNCAAFCCMWFLWMFCACVLSISWEYVCAECRWHREIDAVRIFTVRMWTPLYNSRNYDQIVCVFVKSKGSPPRVNWGN